MNMKRTNFYFPVPMLDQLKQLNATTGVPVSEIIRRAVAEYLAKPTVTGGKEETSYERSD